MYLQSQVAKDLTDGSGVDSCLPSIKISDQKLQDYKSISATNDLPV
jgi:hypothetical protein